MPVASCCLNQAALHQVSGLFGDPGARARMVAMTTKLHQSSYCVRFLIYAAYCQYVTRENARSNATVFRGSVEGHKKLLSDRKFGAASESNPRPVSRSQFIKDKHTRSRPFGCTSKADVRVHCQRGLLSGVISHQRYIKNFTLCYSAQNRIINDKRSKRVTL